MGVKVGLAVDRSQSDDWKTSCEVHFHSNGESETRSHSGWHAENECGSPGPPDGVTPLMRRSTVHSPIIPEQGASSLQRWQFVSAQCPGCHAEIGRCQTREVELKPPWPPPHKCAMAQSNSDKAHVFSAPSQTTLKTSTGTSENAYLRVRECGKQSFQRAELVGY